VSRPAEPDVWITVRDGARLSARLFLPPGGEPHAALLEALPYRKDDLTASYSSEYRRLRDEGGFAVVRLDLRGTGASDGIATDEYPASELRDLADVIAWIADQPWCTGRVGMWGTSYSGFNSLQIAAERPPALGAVGAIYATDDRYTDDVHYMGGALRAIDLVDYCLYMTAMNALPAPPALAGDLDAWRAQWQERIDAAEPWLLRWLEEQHDGPYWRHGTLRRDDSGSADGYERITAATMLVVGWADGYRNNSFRTFERLTCPREMLAGPWSHMSPANSLPGPHVDLVPELIRFFGRWLRDEPDDGTAPVRIYVRRPTTPAPDLAFHAGDWRTEPTWPAPGAAAITVAGPAGPDRSLTVVGDVGTTAWISCAGQLPWGQPTDQRPDDARSLTFDWDPPPGETVVAGTPRLRVAVAADAPVAFLSAKLCDVFPDGTSSLVTRGFRNLTHGASSTAPEPLVRDTPITLDLELEATTWVFEPGHRIRLSLAGTDWPNTWPPPGPVTLTVDPGSVELVLPTLPPASTLPPPTFTPPPTAAAALPDEDGDERPTVWRIEHDVLGRETRAVIDHGTTYAARWGARVTETYSGTVRVSTVDPGRAGADGRARFEVAWNEATACAEARLQLGSDAEAFTVAVELDVDEVRDGDTREIARRRWTRTIPRRLG
jgi:predicted acyl esterase